MEQVKIVGYVGRYGFMDESMNARIYVGIGILLKVQAGKYGDSKIGR